MANLKTEEKKTKAQSMGLHTEVLTGKTQQKFFNPDEAENFFYWGAYDVDFNKTNPGVWTMSMNHFKQTSGFTSWNDYKKDKPMEDDKWLMRIPHTSKEKKH